MIKGYVVVAWTSDEKQYGKRHVLREGGLSIGRDPNNDIVIQDQTASAYHCHITIKNDKVLLHDLQSTNGTLIEPMQFKNRVLSDGDLIWVGATVLKYLNGTDITSHFHKVLSELTITDSVTGVYNARHSANAGTWSSALEGIG